MRRTSASAIAIFLCGCFLLLAPIAASAHHLAEDVGVFGLTPRTQAQVELSAGEFDLGDEHGAWQFVAFSAERTVTQRVSIAARVPFARVRIDGGRTEGGLADVEVGLRALLGEPRDGGVHFACGTGVELPTGDSEIGTGGGHVEWGSYVAGSRRSAGRLVLSGVVSHRLSFEGEEESPEGEVGKLPPHSTGTHTPAEPGADNATHGSVIEPHTNHEIVASVAATHLVEPLFVSLGAERIASIDSPDDPTSLRIETGFLLPGHRRVVTAGIELPIGPDRRLSWRLRGGLR